MARDWTRNGERKRIEADGLTATLELSVTASRRMPRGHEFARQAARGRPYSMVEEEHREWRLHGPGIQPAVIRENPNGTFSVGAYHHVERSPEAAAAWWLGRLARSRRTEPAVESGEVKPSGP